MYYAERKGGVILRGVRLGATLAEMTAQLNQQQVDAARGRWDNIAIDPFALRPRPARKGGAVSVPVMRQATVGPVVPFLPFGPRRRSGAVGPPPPLVLNPALQFVAPGAAVDESVGAPPPERASEPPRETVLVDTGGPSGGAGGSGGGSTVTAPTVATADPQRQEAEGGPPWGLLAVLAAAFVLSRTAR